LWALVSSRSHDGKKRVPINQFSALPPLAGEILNLDNLVLTPDAVPELD
jgi:hypothetical protein